MECEREESGVIWSLCQLIGCVEGRRYDVLAHEAEAQLLTGKEVRRGQGVDSRTNKLLRLPRDN